MRGLAHAPARGRLQYAEESLLGSVAIPEGQPGVCRHERCRVVAGERGVLGRRDGGAVSAARLVGAGAEPQPDRVYGRRLDVARIGNAPGVGDSQELGRGIEATRSQVEIVELLAGPSPDFRIVEDATVHPGRVPLLAQPVEDPCLDEAQAAELGILRRFAARNAAPKELERAIERSPLDCRRDGGKLDRRADLLGRGRALELDIVGVVDLFGG